MHPGCSQPIVYLLLLAYLPPTTYYVYLLLTTHCLTLTRRPRPASRLLRRRRARRARSRRLRRLQGLRAQASWLPPPSSPQHSAVYRSCIYPCPAAVSASRALLCTSLVYSPPGVLYTCAVLLTHLPIYQLVTCTASPPAHAPSCVELRRAAPRA